MKIALISPPWSQKNDFQPLGLGYLAAVLEAGGHQARVYDFTLRERKEHSLLAQEVLRHAPGLIGVTVTTNTCTSSLKLIAAIKQLAPDVKIVVGGPHPSLFAGEMVRAPGVDFAVFGEGEYTLLELAGSRFSVDNLRAIKGLVWKTKETEVVRNQARPPEADLDKFPAPVRSVVGSAGYPYYLASSGRRLATILSSRGCPFTCSYCYKGIFGATYRQRSVENIIAEIQSLKEEYGITFFYFIDDLFIFDHDRIMRLCDRLRQMRLEIEWQCLGRVDLVDPDILRAMHAAGCVQVFYGIESGNRDLIKKTKNVTLDQVRSAVRWAQEAGIRVSGYFMLGLPGDTLESMRQTLKFSSELKLEEAMFSIATPFPGTGLWEEMLRKDASILSADFDCLFYHGNPQKVLFNVSEAAEKDILAMYRRARRLSSYIRARSVLTKRFGPLIGSMLAAFSRLPGARAAGKAVYGRVFCRKRDKGKVS